MANFLDNLFSGVRRAVSKSPEEQAKTKSSNFAEWFPRFFKGSSASLENQADVKESALRAEALARQLSDLPPRPETAPHDAATVLESVCLFLNRLVERNTSKKVQSEKLIHVGDGLVDEPVEPGQSPEAGCELKLSETANEIIRLRDWVLAANTGDGAQSKVLEGLYAKLGQILEKEGVTILEKTGTFDEEYQCVMDIRATEDPAQDNLVCDTVRPGYLFDDELVRPQEVVVYAYRR